MVDPDVVRRGYDELGRAYAASRSGADDLERLEWLLERLAPDATLLDAGCGPGTPLLRRASGTVGAVGVDFSRGQLELAAENAPDTALIQGDLTAMPIAEGAVDAVLAVHSLIHVPRRAHQRVAAEFARVLRPGGWLLCSEGTGEWQGRNTDWLDRGIEMQWDISGPEATRTQLHEAGFAVHEEWTVPDELGGEWLFFGAQLDG